MQGRHASTDLHGGQDQAEEDKHDKDPTELALEENHVAIVSIEVPTDEVREEEAAPVYRVDAA